MDALQALPEGDIQTHVAAVVGIRGMAMNEKTKKFLAEELPVLLCAQFPLDFDRYGVSGVEAAAPCFNSALNGSVYRLVLSAESDDCATAMQTALTQLTVKG